MLASRSDAVWQRLLTAPDTGLVVKAEPTRYRPTAEVRRHVSRETDTVVSDVFPACGETDLDHIVPFNHRRPDQGG